MQQKETDPKNRGAMGGPAGGDRYEEKKHDPSRQGQHSRDHDESSDKLRENREDRGSSRSDHDLGHGAAKPDNHSHRQQDSHPGQAHPRHK